jgi:hypothetical protein
VRLHVAAERGGDRGGGGGVPGQEGSDVGAADPQEVATDLAAHGGRSSLVGQQGHLAEEVAGVKRSDADGVGSGRGGDGDGEGAAADDVEPVGRVPLAEDDVPGREGDALGLGDQPVPGGGGEFGEEGVGGEGLDVTWPFGSGCGEPRVLGDEVANDAQ